MVTTSQKLYFVAKRLMGQRKRLRIATSRSTIVCEEVNHGQWLMNMACVIITTPPSALHPLPYQNVGMDAVVNDSCMRYIMYTPPRRKELKETPPMLHLHTPRHM